MPFLSPEKVKTIKENTGGDKRYLNLSKLPDGKATKLRFVGEGLIGYVAWTENRKPLRWETLPEVLPENIRPDDNGERRAKFFMAGIVWDYDMSMFRVMEITQKGLIESIQKYAADEDYGDPTGYDIQITRTGSGLETRYDLIVKPPSSFQEKCPEGVKALRTLDWDLERLYAGQHPWSEADAAD